MGALKRAVRKLVGGSAYRGLYLMKLRATRFVAQLSGKELWSRVQVKIPTEEHGSPPCAWHVCPRGLGKQSVVYSFGVGEDISFDLSLSSSFGLTVHGFDPTPRAGEWLSRQYLPAQYVFHDYGLADYDGTAEFHPPRRPNNPSFSIVHKAASDESSIKAQVRRLETIMRDLGHDRIDILKMDIEGAEYGVIDQLVAMEAPVRQLLIEFHHRMPNVGIEKTRRSLQQLGAKGYRIFYISPGGHEYSFILSQEA